MKENIRKKLQERRHIVKINELSKLVSPVVYTVRKTQELRMCVDICIANEAIVMETHPILSIK